MEAIAVYAGAREGTNPANAALARAFGEALAEADITLVYGGSKLGLMGEVAEGSSRSIGVLTEHLVNYELQYEGLERLEVVATMSERKARMSELADAIVALPGGAGTLDELFEEWTSQQLGLHNKPIGLLGSEFWAPLVAMIDHMVDQGFMRRTDRAHMVVADDPQELLAKLRAWAPPVPRWL
ncbi:TIGR00730 family Rossman fold protein [Corynebacterium sp. HMSC05H05]|nr:TIGR00730 family Rossman fold protein [Corynebacterium sp. HMSC05H05]OHR18789.1 TIGR00730 family Rossman fold protein [Corynebacterium sp. HMSC034A01]